MYNLAKLGMEVIFFFFFFFLRIIICQTWNFTRRCLLFPSNFHWQALPCQRWIVCSNPVWGLGDLYCKSRCLSSGQELKWGLSFILAKYLNCSAINYSGGLLSFEKKILKMHALVSFCIRIKMNVKTLKFFPEIAFLFSGQIFF